MKRKWEVGKRGRTQKIKIELQVPRLALDRHREGGRMGHEEKRVSNKRIIKYDRQIKEFRGGLRQASVKVPRCFLQRERISNGFYTK